MDAYLRSFLQTARQMLRPQPLRPPTQTPKQADIIRQRYDVAPCAPVPVELQILRQQVHDAYKERGPECICELAGRQKRYLPWILFQGDSPLPVELPGLLSAAIEDFFEFPKWSRLGAWIHVYLGNYDSTQQYTEQLRKFIHDALKHYDGHLSSLKHWRDKAGLLFEEKPLVNLANWYIQQEHPSLDCLSNLGFDGALTTCKFLEEFTRGMIVYGGRRFPDDLDSVLALLEIPDNRGTRERSRRLTSRAASVFIQRTGIDAEEEIKRKLRSVFLRHLNDPRLPYGAPRWKDVDAKAVEIFNQWLSRLDLDFFFDLVDHSAGDSKWQYRRAFWEAYLPHVKMTWIVLGSRARALVRTPQMRALLEDRKYGRLQGASSGQSVFLFRIGDFDFVEWSSSGACRIWPKDETPYGYGESSYYASALRHHSSIASIIHHGSEHYKWQRKLDHWIQSHIGIRPSKSYRLG